MVSSVQASTLKSLSILCVMVPLVFGTMDTYTCMTCFGEKCEVNLGSCVSSNGCFHFQQLYTSPDGSPKLMQAKGCSPTACTPLAFSATLGSGQILGYDFQCCYSENCNQGGTELPPVSKEENGIVCPACYTEDGTDCNPQDLKCTGIETKCVEFVVTGVMPGIPSLKMSGKGCATESTCQLNTNITQSSLSIRINCVNPISGSSPPTPIISSTLTSLLLLRVLL